MPNDAGFTQAVTLNGLGKHERGGSGMFYCGFECSMYFDWIVSAETQPRKLVV